MKTAELTGAALDWAVAKCEGRTVTSFMGGAIWVKGKHEFFPEEDLEGYDFCYNASRLWGVGGPIIEREKIHTYWDKLFRMWSAIDLRNAALSYVGTTPLIAAMRCYVASKLGDEIDIPKEIK